MRTIGVAAVLIAVSLSGGCATITRGTTEVLVVETEPPGADVRISPDGERCSTPCGVTLKRKGDYIVHIERDGFEPLAVNVHPEVAGAGAAGMAGNVLVGGLIGAGVDAVTGATKRLSPNPIRVNLVRRSTAAGSSDLASRGSNEPTGPATAPAGVAARPEQATPPP